MSAGRKILAATLALLAGGCGLGEDGMVLLPDPAWRASIVARSGDGFAVPDGLWWANGRLYMADEGGSAIRVWTGKGRSVALADAADGLRSPEDLAVDGQGNVFFTDDEAGGVRGVDRSGRTVLLARRSAGLGATEGIALDPSGAILIGDADGHRVLGISRTGQVSVVVKGITKPESMAFDEAGNLYIADNEDDILYLLRPDGSLHRPLANRDGFSPETIWYARGALYISDSANGKLHVYSPEDGLSTIAVFGGDLAQVAGVTVDADGAIYLAVQTDLKQKRGYLLRLERGS